MDGHAYELDCTRILPIYRREETLDPQPLRLADGNFNHHAPSWNSEDSIYFKTAAETKEVLIDDEIKDMDFTEVLSLELRGCKGLHRIFSVPAAQLSQLRSLTITIFECEQKQNLEVTTHSWKYRLRQILSSVPQLEEFAINVWYIPLVLQITTLCTFNKSLKTLKLIGNPGNHDGMDQVTVKDLRELQKGCPLLENLEMQMPLFPYELGTYHYIDRTSFEAKEFIAACCDFRRLDFLELSVDDNLGTAKETDASTDKDYDDAMAIMKKMREDKIGVPFDVIILDLKFASRPSNFRPRDSDHWWPQRRTFMSQIVDGRYVQRMLTGEDRIGLAPFDPNNPQSCWLNTPE